MKKILFAAALSEVAVSQMKIPPLRTQQEISCGDTTCVGDLSGSFKYTKYGIIFTNGGPGAQPVSIIFTNGKTGTTGIIFTNGGPGAQPVAIIFTNGNLSDKNGIIFTNGRMANGDDVPEFLFEIGAVVPEGWMPVIDIPSEWVPQVGEWVPQVGWGVVVPEGQQGIIGTKGTVNLATNGIRTNIRKAWVQWTGNRKTSSGSSTDNDSKNESERQ